MACSQENATKGITGLAKSQLPWLDCMKHMQRASTARRSPFFVHQTYLVESLNYC